MLISGFGQFIFWEKGSLSIGSAVSPSELHSHHAIQLSLGLQGKAQFKTTPASEWIEYDGGVIPPDLLHTFQAPGKVLAHIFTQPESQLGRRILRWFGSQEISRLSAEDAHRLGKPLRQAYFNDAPDADGQQLASPSCARDLASLVVAPVQCSVTFSRTTEPLPLRDVPNRNLPFSATFPFGIAPKGLPDGNVRPTQVYHRGPAGQSTADEFPRLGLVSDRHSCRLWHSLRYLDGHPAWWDQHGDPPRGAASDIGQSCRRPDYQTHACQLIANES